MTAAPARPPPTTSATPPARSPTGNWASATQVTGEPTPAAAGTNQNMTVSGLSGDTTYYFAMKTADEVPNWSALSNVLQPQDLGHGRPGGGEQPGHQQPDHQQHHADLDGPRRQRLAPARPPATTSATRTSTITTGNWASATQVTGEPTPAAPAPTRTWSSAACPPARPTTSPSRPRTKCPTPRPLSNVPSGTTSALRRQVPSSPSSATAA